MLVEDFSVFTADFGEPVVYLGNTLTGIFDRQALEVTTDASVSFDSSAPMVGIATADAAGVEYGEVFTIRSQDFKVVRLLHDGQGWSVFELEAQ